VCALFKRQVAMTVKASSSKSTMDGLMVGEMKNKIIKNKRASNVEENVVK
jgi:hypothetical protein